MVQLPFELGQPPVLQLRRRGVVARLLRALDLVAHRFELLLERPGRLDGRLLLLPLRLEPGALLLAVRELLVEPCQSLPGRGVRLLAQRFPLDLQLHDAALNFVQLDGQRVDLGPQRRGGFVDEIDGLVGQEAVADVAVGQHGRGDQGRILDPDAVVNLVALPQAAQHADGVLDRGLRDEHGLKAALERRVLLDVLAVLVEGRGPDRVQLAAREHRLQHVGRVDRALRGAGSHHRVQLVDEQHDGTGRVGHLREHGLEPLFELAAVLGAGNQGTHVEGDNPFPFQALGHVLSHDPLRETLHDGRLADTGLADQHRVVLRTPREHLHETADFLVPTDDRVELALTRELRELAPVALERFVLGFRVRVGDPLRSANRRQRLVDPVADHAGRAQNPGGRRAPALGGQGEQQMLGADVLVLQAPGLAHGLIDHLTEPRRLTGRCAAARRRHSSPGTMPSGCSVNAMRRCSGSSSGCPACSASCCADSRASCAFSVVRFMLTQPSSSPVGPSASRGRRGPRSGCAPRCSVAWGLPRGRWQAGRRTRSAGRCRASPCP